MDGLRSPTLRGAAAGILAAAVWAAQQPLDRRVFGVPYDDTELLGKLVTRGRHWRAVGLAAHLANGALFGVGVGRLAPRVPLPGVALGTLAGAVEHLASWPFTRLSDAMHPARRQMPALWGNHAAFAQATWRHLLFGTVLGLAEHALAPRRPAAGAAAAEAPTPTAVAPTATPGPVR